MSPAKKRRAKRATPRLPSTPAPGPEAAAPSRPLIVGIGASAGGLEALEKFFEHMPSESGMAFVVVTHQQVGRTSMLPTLLGRRTSMPVGAAVDHSLVEPNHVYVSPPGKNVALLKRRLQLMDPAPGTTLHLPIDYFFRSLAHDQEDRAVCIVLSGTGTDGTLGLREIKAHTGMAIVQDEASANYAGMPHSAASTHLADYVLPPHEMPAQLLSYATVAPLLPQTSEASDAELDDALPKIYVLLRNRLGHDFSSYKQNTMRRRIERRMRVHQLERPAEYVHLLQAESHELDLLFQELLISVTQFFRDPQAYDVLASQLAERIVRATYGEPLRVWVAACSTGEEAYSIAMLASELAHKANLPLHMQVFATDLDPTAIGIARIGTYPGGIVADVGAERLARFFVPEGSGFRVRKDLRDRIVFATHNILRDPPFTKLDLLSCRNLLIYLDTQLQQGLFPLFHYALQPGGLLWLGSSESATGHAELFTVIDRQWKVYERRASLRGTVPVFERRPTARPDAGVAPPPQPGAAPALRIATSMATLLLERFAPPTLVVNERGEIAYIHGRTGEFLEPSTGEPRHNLFEMAREGLRTGLRSVIRAAIAADREVTQAGISVRTNGGLAPVTVIAYRLSEPESLRGLIRVSFQITKAAPEPKPGGPRSKHTQPTPAGRFEQELSEARESLAGTLVELQSTNEELKSSNEELQSTNEELQSTNEELESSKEELQSLNEELETVNAELQRKIAELDQLNDDMQNMLNGTEIATLFLDRELRIKRFTEQARRVVRLIATDVGRPLADLVPQVRYAELTEHAERVLRTLVPHEAEVQALDGHWLLVRMLPYRTGQNRIEGVVITFVDIDRVKRAEGLAASRALAESIVQTVREPLLVLDGSLTVVASNRAFARLLGREQPELQGCTLEQVAGALPLDRLRPLLDEVVAHGKPLEACELTTGPARPGQPRILLNARRLEDISLGNPGLILVVLVIEEAS